MYLHFWIFIFWCWIFSLSISHDLIISLSCRTPHKLGNHHLSRHRPHLLHLCVVIHYIGILSPESLWQHFPPGLWAESLLEQRMIQLTMGSHLLKFVCFKARVTSTETHQLAVLVKIEPIHDKLKVGDLTGDHQVLLVPLIWQRHLHLLKGNVNLLLVDSKMLS